MREGVVVSHVAILPERYFRVNRVTGYRTHVANKENRARTIGARAKAMRLARGLTQVQLSALANIGQSAISSIETGDTKWMRGGNLLRIAEALAVNAVWLETGFGDPQVNVQTNTDDAAILDIARQLNPANRAAWIAAGKAMVETQPAKASSSRPFRKLKP